MDTPQDGENTEEKVINDVQDSSGNFRKVEEDIKEANERHLRLLAEFENFKKRTLKERSDLLKYQGEQIFVDMIEILDNLELALEHSTADPDKLKTGLELIKKMFVDKLNRWEVKSESGIGKEFNPQQYAAISQVKDPSAKPGTIVGELKKPYFYKDRLIRVGEVVVATDSDG